MWTMSSKLNVATAWKVFVFGVILVRIFLHSNWIRSDTSYLSVFSPNMRKCGPVQLRIRTLFTDTVYVAQWYSTLYVVRCNNIMVSYFKWRHNTTAGKSPLLSWKIFTSIMVKTCVLYTSHKIHLILKFIEIDEASVNLLHNYSKSGCHKLQKFQQFQETIRLMFQSMLS